MSYSPRATAPGPGDRESISQTQLVECATERSPGALWNSDKQELTWLGFLESRRELATQLPGPATQTNSSKGHRLRHSSEPDSKAAPIHRGPVTNQSTIQERN